MPKCIQCIVTRVLIRKKIKKIARCVFRHYNFVKFILSKSLFKNVLKNLTSSKHLNEIIAIWYDFTIYEALYNPFGCNNKHVLFHCIFNNSRWRGRITNDNVNFLQTSVEFPLSSDRDRRSYSKQNWFPILKLTKKNISMERGWVPKLCYTACWDSIWIKSKESEKKTFLKI